MKINTVHIKKTGLAIAAVVGTVFVLVLLFTTTPKTLGPGGVTAWFIALLIALISILTYILMVIKNRFFSGREDETKTVNSSFRTAFLAGIGIVSILALRSLGTLGLKDIVLLLLILLIIEVFLRTRGVLS